MKPTESLIRCAITGLEWNVPFFPGAQKSQFVHPIFTVPLKTLWKNVPLATRLDWDIEETGLFTLAIFTQTQMAQFIPANPSDFISMEEFELLFEESERIFALVKRALQLPSAAKLPKIILQCGSSGENSLSRIPDFLYILHDEIDKYHEGYATATQRKKNADRLVRLERFIRRNAVTSKNRRALGKILGEWASISAEFDEFLEPQQTPYGNIPLTNYWKQIISMCVAGTENLWQIPASDFKELLEHCEDNLNHGTFYAAELMKFLREGAAIARDSLGIDNLSNFSFLSKFETEKDCYQILDEFIGGNEIPVPRTTEAEILKSFVESMKLTAPKEEPKRAAFPNQLEFLRAKARWELSNAGK